RLSPDFDRAGVAPQHLERKGAVRAGKSNERRVVLGEEARKAGELQAPGLDLPERLRGKIARQLSVGQDQGFIGARWFGSGMAEDQEARNGRGRQKRQDADDLGSSRMAFEPGLGPWTVEGDGGNIARILAQRLKGDGLARMIGKGDRAKIFAQQRLGGGG